MNDFKQLVEKTPLDQKSKVTLIELFGLLNEDGKQFLYTSLNDEINKNSST